MSFFKGYEKYSVDAKGRINIPVKMRKALSPEAGDTFVITRGGEECIALYPLDEWKRYEERFRSLNQYDAKNRYFLRILLMWSEEVKLDAQQRIMIPKNYIDFAGISKQAIIVGMVDHIEFWDPEKFDKYISESGESYDAVASRVMNTI